MAKLNSSHAGALRTKAVVKPLLRALRNAFDTAFVAAPAIRFEPLEPRVLLSGEANPAQSVSGSIDVPGEADHYGIVLAEDTRIVFDSLTSSNDFNWTLKGPTGTEVSNRGFASSDS